MLATVVLLSVVGNRLVEGLITPLFNKFQWDKFWLLYIAWAITTPLVLLTGANLFTGDVQLSPAIAGRILTGIIAGGGANFIHDIFDAKT